MVALVSVHTLKKITLCHFFDAPITAPEVWGKNIPGPMALPGYISILKII
jgi:hypothetical protein